MPVAVAVPLALGVSLPLCVSDWLGDGSTLGVALGVDVEVTDREGDALEDGVHVAEADGVGVGDGEPVSLSWPRLQVVRSATTATHSFTI